MNLEELRKFKPQIIELASKYNAENIRVFGSITRRENTKTSDIDFLAHFNKGASLLDIIGFEQKLNELLKTKIDLVDDEAIYDDIKPIILEEATPL